MLHPKIQKLVGGMRCLLIRIFLVGLFGRVPAGRASADYATLQNILRMVPLRVLRIPRAIYLC